jgi:hypothetical protein
VRFGCDGYIKTPTLAYCRGTAARGTEVPTPFSEKLQIEPKGNEIYQVFIFEIKTRHISRQIDMEDVLPKL